MSEVQSTKAGAVGVNPPIRRTPEIIRSALFGIVFIAAVSLTVLGTLYSLSANPERVEQAYPLLLFNMGVIWALAIYLGYRIWTILFAKRVRRSAPLLHRRFVLFFSLAALIPAILVGVFSTSLITRNINDLFGDDVRATLDDAYGFLNQYVTEELRDLSVQVLNSERFMQANQDVFENRITFTAYLQRFSRNLGSDAIYVLNREGIVYSSAISPNSPELKIPMPVVFDYLDSSGATGFQMQEENDYLVGLTKLDGYPDAYLMVGQYLKSNVGVLSSLQGIQDAKQSLTRYQIDQGLFRKTFFLTLTESALLIMIAAIWMGAFLATTIIAPLGRIIQAAEKVRGGDLSARVAVKRDWGEMSDLGSAFNRMTRQLSSQREDLIREHDVSEQRRQFSEAVLSGVTAGVIGLSQDGRITLMNASAERLTGQDASQLLGHPLGAAFPEFSEAFIAAREHVMGQSADQVNLDTPNGVRNFDMRVSAYKGAREDTGWVLTFDDMTRLVAAQRHSAWREVARRIAHEIKNPLTPIQLSAERLKRKYKGKISTDPEVFENCTDTIIRQVGSLEQMVDEFSSFARMPAPEFEIIDFKVLMETTLFAQGVAFPDVKFAFEQRDSMDDVFMAFCDERMIGQALTNIYKNAAESIARRVDEAGLDVPDGEIVTVLSQTETTLILSITDNGVGWPFEDKDRHLEPYVTTRDSGTGLGLAIVKRIAEDHGGQLLLADRDDNKQGAHLEFRLPRPQLETNPETLTGQQQSEFI